jgi:hypothetical protein
MASESAEQRFASKSSRDKAELSSRRAPSSAVKAKESLSVREDGTAAASFSKITLLAFAAFNSASSSATREFNSWTTC